MDQEILLQPRLQHDGEDTGGTDIHRHTRGKLPARTPMAQTLQPPHGKAELQLHKKHSISNLIPQCESVEWEESRHQRWLQYANHLARANWEFLPKGVF